MKGAAAINNNKLDKRAAGVIKWLERFQHEYKSGAIESALMDAECARADLEALRQDVWSSVDVNNKKFKFNFKFAFGIALAALSMVLMTALPIAKDLNNLKIIELEVKEPENKINEINLKINNNIAENSVKLNNNNLNKNLNKNLKLKAKAVKPAKPEKSVKNIKADKAVKSGAKALPYDKMFSLLQTGARELRGSSSAIEIK